MSQYIVTGPARGDLYDIWEYIAAGDGVERADRFVGQLFAAMEKIAEQPGMGHQRSDLSNDTLKVWTVKSVMIVYEPHTHPLRIIRVIHGSRDISALSGES